MPGAKAVWARALAKGRGPASRRPKSRKITDNNQATSRLGGTGVGFVGGPAATSNAVAGTNIPNSKDPGRTSRGGGVL